MKALFVLVALAPGLAFAAPSPLAEAARVEAAWQKARAAHDLDAERAVLSEAARLPWPLINTDLERAIAEQRTKLNPAARSSWALNRALPMLAGQLSVSDDILNDVLEEVAAATPADSTVARQDLTRLQSARDAYSRRELRQAETRYAAVTKSSSVWPDALRERAWTLLLMGRPQDALGATVSLNAPYFPPEDHAEARLLKAAVLLRRCRFGEARDTIAALADMTVPQLDENTANTVLASTAPPKDPLVLRAWSSPLVSRVRTVLSAPADGEDAAITARRQALTGLARKLIAEAYAADAEVSRELKERALKVRYEALKGERSIIEQGISLAEPVPEKPKPLEDDEVAWGFDGTFWRDELGTYRYSAGDACPQISGR
jgi:hypothetical protein